MFEVSATKCCGMKELNNLGECETPQEALEALVRWIYENERGVVRFGLVMFSGVTQRRTKDHSSAREDNYGQAFADIVEGKLGSVVASHQATNPKTSNGITAWIWKVDQPALQTLVTAHKDATVAARREYVEEIHNAPHPVPGTTAQNRSGSTYRVMAIDPVSGYYTIANEYGSQVVITAQQWRNLQYRYTTQYIYNNGNVGL